MPHEWNNIIVVTMHELVPNWYTWPALKATLYRHEEKQHGIKRVQKGGNGRNLLIEFDSLPEEVRRGIGDPRLVNHALEQYYRIDREATNFYSTFKLPEGGYLADEYRDRYVYNASVLKALISLRNDILKERKRKNQNTTGIDAMLCEHAATFRKTLQVKHRYEHTLPESLKRFKGVLNEFETKGYKSLISGKHGNDNSRKVNSATVTLLESMFAKDATKPNVTDVYNRYDAFLRGDMEIINNQTAEIYNPTSFKKLSVNTVAKYLGQWQSKVSTHLLRSGNRQEYMGAYKPYHSHRQPKYAGEIISVDDRQPPFKTLEGKRLWFYIGIDLASEAIVAYVYGDDKDHVLIKEFYRTIVRNYDYWGYRLPDGIEAESNLNSSYINTFLKEGAMFQNVRIEANNARGKKIERLFGKLRYEIEKRREGWIARPHARSESNKPGAKEPPRLPKAKIIDACLEDIEFWNNQPHSKTPELSRWEYFDQHQHPDLKPVNYETFLPHLVNKTVTSCGTNGIIRFDNSEYLIGENGKVCVDKTTLISLMSRIAGKNIEIYALDGLGDKGMIKALVYLNGQLICEAVKKPIYSRSKLGLTEADVDAKETMSKYTAIIDSYAKCKAKAIDSVTIIDNTPAPRKTFFLPELQIKRTAEQSFEKPKTDLRQINLDDDDILELPETFTKSFVTPLKETF